jgi:hypothetical protein
MSSATRRLLEEKSSCGRTKCESIVVNVLAAFTMQQVLEEMESVKYLTVMIDTLNHKNLKLVLVLVRYFTPEKRIQTKFHSLRGETADVLTTHIMNVVHKYKLPDKVITFCGNNCNTNFGGATRRGTNNVFAKLKTSSLKMKTQGVGCAAHILHYALQRSADILPVDVEAIPVFSHIYGTGGGIEGIL